MASLTLAAGPFPGMDGHLQAGLPGFLEDPIKGLRRKFGLVTRQVQPDDAVPM